MKKTFSSSIYCIKLAHQDYPNRSDEERERLEEETWRNRRVMDVDDAVIEEVESRR